MYVTSQNECWKLDSLSVELVPQLQSNQEEADTRTLLHARHVIINGPAVVHCDDTDVLILLLSHSNTLRQCYVKKIKGTKATLMELEHISNGFLTHLSPGISRHDFLQSLIGFHAFIRCDSVSAFAGKGKWKGLQFLFKNGSYVRAMMELGESWRLADETFEVLESFGCSLYGKKIEDVDLLHYELHCSKGDIVEPKKQKALPPCKFSLRLNALRANNHVVSYAAAA